MSAITILFFFVPVLVGILLMANILLAPSRPYSEKVTEYECGFSSILGQTRAPFSIQYYLVGILFMLFDLEVLLLYPIAVTMSDLTLMGYWVAMIFAGVLTMGFVVEIASRVLYFTEQRSTPITSSSR